MTLSKEQIAALAASVATWVRDRAPRFRVVYVGIFGLRPVLERGTVDAAGRVTWAEEPGTPAPDRGGSGSRVQTNGPPSSG